MSVFDSSSTVNTTLPSWFTSAQQAIATQAPQTYQAATAPGSTVASGLISDLNSQTKNPFTTAISGLQTAQTANANPFLPTGAPNTATPLGGLFAAQNARLDQILPELTAQVGAGGIGTGNYGSLRGQTATNTASVGSYGQSFYSSSTVDATETQALGNAQWISNNFNDPYSLRFTCTFDDVAQNATALTAFMQQIFGGVNRTINFKYQVPGGSETTVACVIEGYSINATPESTQYVLNLSPLQYYQFFTLNSTTLGILDTSRLGW